MYELFKGFCLPWMLDSLCIRNRVCGNKSYNKMTPGVGAVTSLRVTKSFLICSTSLHYLHSVLTFLSKSDMDYLHVWTAIPSDVIVPKGSMCYLRRLSFKPRYHNRVQYQERPFMTIILNFKSVPLLHRGLGKKAKIAIRFFRSPVKFVFCQIAPFGERP